MRYSVRTATFWTTVALAAGLLVAILVEVTAL